MKREGFKPIDLYDFTLTDLCLLSDDEDNEPTGIEQVIAEATEKLQRIERMTMKERIEHTKRSYGLWQ